VSLFVPVPRDPIRRAPQTARLLTGESSVEVSGALSCTLGGRLPGGTAVGSFEETLYHAGPNRVRARYLEGTGETRFESQCGTTTVTAPRMRFRWSVTEPAVELALGHPGPSGVPPPTERLGWGLRAWDPERDRHADAPTRWLRVRTPDGRIPPPDSVRGEEVDPKQLEALPGVLLLAAGLGAPAATGLQGGDRIVAVNGSRVRYIADLRAAIDRSFPGQEVTITFRRGDEATERSVSFRVGPADLPRAPRPRPAIVPPRQPTRGEGSVHAAPVELWLRGMTARRVKLEASQALAVEKREHSQRGPAGLEKWTEQLFTAAAGGLVEVDDVHVRSTKPIHVSVGGNGVAIRIGARNHPRAEPPGDRAAPS
jgi:hypothetical protein